MLKVRVFAFALAAALFIGVPQAKATDPCEPGVMAAMSEQATKGFARLSNIAVSLLKPPPPAAASNCMRSLFDIWAIDPVLLTPVTMFPTGTLGYTAGGFTLTHSSLAIVAIEIIQKLFNDKFGQMICGELWNNIGEALRPIQFGVDGSVQIDKAIFPTFPGLSKALGFISGPPAPVFGTTVDFDAFVKDMGVITTNP